MLPFQSPLELVRLSLGAVSPSPVVVPPADGLATFTLALEASPILTASFSTALRVGLARFVVGEALSETVAELLTFDAGGVPGAGRWSLASPGSLALRSADLRPYLIGAAGTVAVLVQQETFHNVGAVVLVPLELGGGA